MARAPRKSKSDKPDAASPPAPPSQGPEAAAEAPAKKTRAPRAKKPVAAGAPSPLSVAQVASPTARADLGELATAVAQDGGAVLARYREPYGGHDVLVVALPLDKVEPTPYQRDPSPAHVKKLARSIEKVGRFLDPVLAVRHGGRYWIPNGGHRLEALKAAGGATIVALLIPETDVAHKILALNTEKAHNLKERALEVVRLERALAAAGETRPETEFEVELEEGALVTLGAAFERRPRLAGGAYGSILRKTDPLAALPLAMALLRRERLAETLLEIDDAVSAILERLKARGIKSAFLRPFVVGRVNPVGKSADPATFPKTTEEALARLLANAKAFDPESVQESDLAFAAGPPPSEGDEDEG